MPKTSNGIEMPHPKGSWKNPPLAYVLAEIRTENIADLENYQSVIAGEFRERYPVQRIKQATTIVVGQSLFEFRGGPEKAWEYAEPENTVAVLVRPNGLALHLTRYQDHEDFLGKLDHAVQIFTKVVPSVYVNRIGLRYIDFIIPQPGDLPENFVAQKFDLNMGLGSPSTSFAANVVTIYPMAHGQLTHKYTRAQGKPELPSEIGAVTLEFSPALKDAAIVADQPTAVFDSDRTIDFSPVQKLNAVEIGEHYKGMHADISRGFNMAITEHAKKVWGKQ